MITPEDAKKAVKVLEQVDEARKRLAGIREARKGASYVNVEVRGSGRGYSDTPLLTFTSGRHQYGKAPAESIVSIVLNEHEKHMVGVMRDLGRQLAQLGVICPADIGPGGTP